MAHVAAIALVEAVGAVLPARASVRIKWPNDLLIGPAKVAGILVEATTDIAQHAWYVVGLGVNCIHHPDGLAYPTTDLTEAAGRTVHPDEVFAGLQRSFASALSLWNAGAGFSAVRQRWLSHALPLGTTLTARLPDRTIDGGFGGMDETGRLLLDTMAGRLTIQAAEIHVGTLAAGLVG